MVLNLQLWSCSSWGPALVQMEPQVTSCGRKGTIQSETSDVTKSWEYNEFIWLNGVWDDRSHPQNRMIAWLYSNWTDLNAALLCFAHGMFSQLNIAQAWTPRQNENQWPFFKAMAHRQEISLDLRFETEVDVFQLMNYAYGPRCPDVEYVWICWFLHACSMCMTMTSPPDSAPNFGSKRRTRIAKMQFSMLTRMVESVSLEASQRNKEVEKKQKKTPKLTGPKWLDLNKMICIFL